MQGIEIISMEDLIIRVGLVKKKRGPLWISRLDFKCKRIRFMRFGRINVS